LSNLLNVWHILIWFSDLTKKLELNLKEKILFVQFIKFVNWNLIIGTLLTPLFGTHILETLVNTTFTTFAFKTFLVTRQKQQNKTLFTRDLKEWMNFEI